MGDSDRDHNNKEWRKTIALARRYGWGIREAKDHGGLILLCPCTDPGKRHKIRVYSTGNGTESVARRERRTIERCEHRDISDSLGDADGLLDHAERYLRAAAALMDRADAEGEMEELLNLAGEQLDEAQAAFDAASTRFDSAGEEVRQLLDGESAGLEAEALLRGAGSRIRTAEQAVRALPTSHDAVAQTTERIDTLRARHADLQQRMEARSHS